MVHEAFCGQGRGELPPTAQTQFETLASKLASEEMLAAIEGRRKPRSTKPIYRESLYKSLCTRPDALS
jgi:hypothetical protein